MKVWTLAIAVLLALTVLPATAQGMTRTQVRNTLKEAAHHYHLSAKCTRFIVKKGTHIAWGESRYHVHTGHASGCLGLFQFDTDWKHHITIGHRHYRDFRWSGRASCYRFVKVYKQGGKAAIKRHWKATY